MIAMSSPEPMYFKKFGLTSKASISILIGILTSHVAGTCYSPPGVAAGSGQTTDLSSWTPCNPSGNVVSMCCNKGNGDTCTSQGLCETGGGFWRDWCTDPTWQSAGCLKICMDIYNPQLLQCGDGSWCCGGTNTTCCQSGQGVFLAQTSLVAATGASLTTPSTKSTASSTTPSTTASLTPSSSSSPTTQSSTPTNYFASTSSSSPSVTQSPAPTSSPEPTSSTNGKFLGLGLGIGIGISAIALLTFGLWYLKKRRSSPTPPLFELDPKPTSYFGQEWEISKAPVELDTRVAPRDKEIYELSAGRYPPVSEVA